MEKEGKQAEMKIFISYHNDPERPQDKALAHRISYYLRKQPAMDVFCYEYFNPNDRDRTWEDYVVKPLYSADCFLFLASNIREGRDGMKTSQMKELEAYLQGGKGLLLNILLTGQALEHNYTPQPNVISRDLDVSLSGHKHFPLPNDPVEIDQAARLCAEKIWKEVGGMGVFVDDDLPNGYPFDYEKDIIDMFADPDKNIINVAARCDGDYSETFGDAEKAAVRIASGALLDWPSVEQLPHEENSTTPRPLPKELYGEYRDDQVVLVDPRGKYHRPSNSRNKQSDEPECREERCLARKKLWFPEAGPRSKIAFPHKTPDKLTIAILVSGGIAPGINSVVAGIVDRHVTYAKLSKQKYTLRIRLILEGFSSLRSGVPGFRTISRDNTTKESEGHFSAVVEQIHEYSKSGGSIELRTSRCDDLLPGQNNRIENLDEVIKSLRNQRPVPDILYIIGGEGSMRGAHALAKLLRLRKGKKLRNMRVVGVPKTMDNDILWVWQSFGFLSAVEQAKQFISQLYTEIRSNPRLCVLQLFGSDSGFVVSHATLGASSNCFAALIPEVSFTMKALGEYITQRLRVSESRQIDDKPYGMVVMAETAIPLDVDDFLHGQGVSGLSHTEVDAVRDFTGSSYLCGSDIQESEWGRFVEKLLSKSGSLEVDDRWVMAIFERCKNWEALLKGVQSADKDSLAALKPQLIELLNQGIICDPILPKKQWKLENEPYNTFGAALLRAIRECCKTKPDFRKIASVCRTLTHLIALPYEAFRAVEVIERHVAKPEENPPPVFEIGQLKKRLVERYNRMVFDSVFVEFVVPYPSEQRVKRVQGQTNDALRSGGLKILSQQLKTTIEEVAELNRDKLSKKYWKEYRVFCNEPRHLIRAIEPSCHDIIFTHRLGKLAVDGAMAGYTDFMISQWLTEFVMVPLSLVVQGRKRVPDTGIFWKSVIASTQQGDLSGEKWVSGDHGQ